MCEHNSVAYRQNRTSAGIIAIAAVNMVLLSVLNADTNISGRVALTENQDWRGRGVVLSDGATIDLAGYVLAVDALKGNGSITSTVATASFVRDITPPQTSQTAPNAVESFVENSAGNLSTTTASMFSGDSQAWRAFGDYDSYNTSDHRVCYLLANGKTLAIDYVFAVATIVDAYSLTAADAAPYGQNPSTSPARAPKSWTLLGLDDGTDWRLLHSPEDQTGWTRGEKREFVFENAKAYKRYRILITANNGDPTALEFFKIEYGRLANTLDIASGIELDGDLDLRGVETRVEGCVQLNGHSLFAGSISGSAAVNDSTRFDLTSSSGAVSSSGTFLSTGPAAAAFADYASYGSGQRVIAELSANTLPINIDYDFGDGRATVVDSYRIMATSVEGTASTRAPKSFKFYGSNDGNDWTLLDERANETGWRPNEIRQYEFANTVSYRRYRIALYGSVSDGYIEFFKLEYGNVAVGGKFCVSVPAGKTVDNSTMSIGGNLRLVKDGEGTYVMSVASQPYGGGTEVRAGVLKCGVPGLTHPLGDLGRPVTVRRGAVVDFNGQTGYYDNEFVLDGGMLRNSGASAPSGNAQLKRMSLTADSALAFPNSYSFIGNNSVDCTIYLNGHTLTAEIGTAMYLSSVTAIDGAIEFRGAGILRPLDTGSGFTATNVVLTIGCRLNLGTGKGMSVRDYVSIYSGMGNDGSALFNVYGSFRPKTTSFYGCTLQDGATLDLSEWSESAGWPVASAFTVGARELKFAEGTSDKPNTVTVKFDGKRSDVLENSRKAGGFYLYKWSEKPTNVSFVLHKTVEERFVLTADAAGLLLSYRWKGLTVNVR